MHDDARLMAVGFFLVVVALFAGCASWDEEREAQQATFNAAMDALTPEQRGQLLQMMLMQQMMGPSPSMAVGQSLLGGVCAAQGGAFDLATGQCYRPPQVNCQSRRNIFGGYDTICR